MVIPPPSAWTELGAGAKRERLLDAARELFARKGLGAPMPAVAAAAGVGVGSIYRQFADKDDLVSALVLRRLAEVRDLIEAAPATGNAWADLEAMLWRIIDSSGGCDDLTAEAIALTSERLDVIGAREEVAEAIERVLARAREEGTLRADAEVQDVRLLLTAYRAAEGHSEGGGRRLAQLMLDALRASERPPAASGPARLS